MGKGKGEKEKGERRKEWGDCVCDLSWGSCKEKSYGYAKRSSPTLGFHFDWVAGGLGIYQDRDP
jgi:hypothetical protein